MLISSLEWVFSVVSFSIFWLWIAVFICNLISSSTSSNLFILKVVSLVLNSFISKSVIISWSPFPTIISELEFVDNKIKTPLSTSFFPTPQLLKISSPKVFKSFWVVVYIPISALVSSSISDIFLFKIVSSSSLIIFSLSVTQFKGAS